MGQKNDLSKLVRKQSKQIKEKEMNLKSNEKFVMMTREEFINLPSLFPQEQADRFDLQVESSEYKSLEESLISIGFIQNPILFNTDEGYKIFIGHRRQDIVRKHPEVEKFETVNCKAMDISLEEAEIMFMDDNIKGGRQFSHVEMAEMIARETELYKEIAKKTGKKININQEIATSLDMSKRSVERHKNVNDLIPEFKELFSKQSFSFLSQATIGRMKEDEQKELHNALGDSILELREKDIKKLKDGFKNDRQALLKQLEEAKEIQIKLDKANEEVEKFKSNEELHKNTEEEMLKAKSNIQKLKDEQANIINSAVSDAVIEREKVIKDLKKSLDESNTKLDELKKDKDISKETNETISDVKVKLEVGKAHLLSAIESFRSVNSLLDKDIDSEVKVNINKQVNAIINEYSKTLKAFKK